MHSLIFQIVFIFTIAFLNFFFFFFFILTKILMKWRCELFLGEFDLDRRTHCVGYMMILLSVTTCQHPRQYH